MRRGIFQRCATLVFFGQLLKFIYFNTVPTNLTKFFYWLMTFIQVSHGRDFFRETLVCAVGFFKDAQIRPFFGQYLKLIYLNTVPTNFLKLFFTAL